MKDRLSNSKTSVGKTIGLFSIYMSYDHLYNSLTSDYSNLKGIVSILKGNQTANFLDYAQVGYNSVPSGAEKFSSILCHF